MFLRYRKATSEDFSMLVFPTFYPICHICQERKDYTSEHACRSLIHRKYMISGRDIGLKNYSITGDNMLEFVFNQYSSMNLGNISEGTITCDSHRCVK